MTFPSSIMFDRRASDSTRHNVTMTEIWVEYSIGLAILLCRIICRCLSVGSKWDGDDYCSVAAVFLWTVSKKKQNSMAWILDRLANSSPAKAMVTLVSYIARKTASIATRGHRLNTRMTDDEENIIVVSRKCVLVLWCGYVLLIWLLKACMLFLYQRLTLNLKQERLVKITAWICAVAFIAAIAVVLGHCSPIHKKWQITPYPGDACVLGTPIYYAIMATNVPTDLLIAVIPIPLLLTVQLPWKKYATPACGVFIVIATILRCVLSLQHLRSPHDRTVWSIREAAIGIVAANMPIVGPWLARGVRRVPSLRSRQASAYGADGTKASPAGTHELSVLDKGAKEKSGRKGLGWTTMDGESNECMVEEADHQMHAGLSRERSRDTNASSSSARAVEGPPAQDIGISQAIY
ncbi:uncharacterized protein UV8b_00118 [Ustilaginoidea virens]|uniref:Rhodopsin domain-containing protein n=1 Tax=Ustilaginoidea virens TaxID=1159556 RepID=A0A8E5ME23_USTVR|nr:uncharacterized protein UV8b_00118 [Ustilaginoidea virens]QUC15877.1 hypothetical protein UV8b_00118 [Ustilaginoidea virens]